MPTWVIFGIIGGVLGFVIPKIIASAWTERVRHYQRELTASQRLLEERRDHINLLDSELRKANDQIRTLGYDKFNLEKDLQSVTSRGEALRRKLEELQSREAK